MQGQSELRGMDCAEPLLEAPSVASYTQTGPPLLKLIFISDLHTMALPPLPPGDILLVTGDLSEGRSCQLHARLAEFIEARQLHGYEYVVVFAGNHDRALEANCDSRDVKIFNDLDEGLGVREAFRSTPGIVYLENELTELTVKGRSIKIWGAPLSLATSRQTAFGCTEEEAEVKWDCVPENIDILLTHGPPKGYLDNRMGCKFLTQLLWKVKPRVHAFGHVHSAWGKVAFSYDSAPDYHQRETTVLVNSALHGGPGGKHSIVLN